MRPGIWMKQDAIQRLSFSLQAVAAQTGDPAADCVLRKEVKFQMLRLKNKKCSHQWNCMNVCNDIHHLCLFWFDACVGKNTLVKVQMCTQPVIQEPKNLSTNVRSQSEKLLEKEIQYSRILEIPEKAPPPQYCDPVAILQLCKRTCPVAWLLTIPGPDPEGFLHTASPLALCRTVSDVSEKSCCEKQTASWLTLDLHRLSWQFDPTFPVCPCRTQGTSFARRRSERLGWRHHTVLLSLLVHFPVGLNYGNYLAGQPSTRMEQPWPLPSNF